jgi:hypothetical protein
LFFAKILETIAPTSKSDILSGIAPHPTAAPKEYPEIEGWILAFRLANLSGVSFDELRLIEITFSSFSGSQ